MSTTPVLTGTTDVRNRETLKYSRSPDPLVGRILDSKYEILERLGQGGMGAVYRAKRLHIGDEVAVKVLHTDLIVEPRAIERFRREARSAAMINHPNVVSIHDFSDGQSSESPAYIVMEFVRGKSLRSLLKRHGRLSPSRAVDFMRDICAGLGMAHRNGVIHRDLKPDNVIVAAANHEGEDERVKVVDFGIAKLRNTPADFTVTQTGAIMGTIYYMSPEQCRGEEIDARTDVYSLGAMFYEMLTGDPPFRANNIAALISKHLTETPAPFPSELRIPPALAATCFRALAKNRDERQADASAFARELQPLAIPIADSQPSERRLPAKAVSTTSSNWIMWTVGGLAVFLIVLVVSGAIALYLYNVGISNTTSNSNNTANRPKPLAAAEESEAQTSPVDDASTNSTVHDLRGTWSGTYGPLNQPATLMIKNQNGKSFDGILQQAEAKVAFSGAYNAKSLELSIKELEVLAGSGWSLGENVGKLSADGKTMSGTGKDAIGGQFGISYQWSFSRQ
ncbi:MAG: serine/threonine protein kinase [Pyrinomonadaceae bacterium]|nr:serine/threonine protein kinase [Pyrinomonadaceae bacterium]